MRSLFVTLSLSLSVSLVAEEVKPQFVRDAVGVKSYASAPRLAERLAIRPAITLGASSEIVPEEIEAIETWNRELREPAKNGFTRPLPDPISVRISDPGDAKAAGAAYGRGAIGLSDRGSILWSCSVEVRRAYRFRLHLTNVELPANTTLWIYGSDGNAIGFGPELVDANGSLYTPSVAGEIAYIEAEVPAGSHASFDIRDVVELLGPAPTPLDSPACLVDATCVTSATLTDIASFRHAVAHLQYVHNGSSFVCTGTLLNDKDESTTIPYLLTANHCISDQATATSLEAYFDYYTASCGGAFPAISSKPRTLGSQLLATGAAPNSDFTLLKLSSMPSGRWLLGWTTAPVTAGTTVYRVSHPFPDSFSQPAPQSFSTNVVVNPASTCQGFPSSTFLYSNYAIGGTYGGSSGSAAFTSSGQVVGQLYGICGPSPTEGCNAANHAIDGAFASSFPSLQQYLNVSGTTPCVASATVVCLNSNRFSVKVDWKRPGGESGQGQGIKYTDNSGLFWFFSSDNIELIVKVLTGCPLSNTYWVFSAATTNVEYTMTVVDTKTGQVKTYFNPQGVSAAAITDTSAFATCP
jgi:lysyl endopeptidase